MWLNVYVLCFVLLYVKQSHYCSSQSFLIYVYLVYQCGTCILQPWRFLMINNTIPTSSLLQITTIMDWNVFYNLICITDVNCRFRHQILYKSTHFVCYGLETMWSLHHQNWYRISQKILQLGVVIAVACCNTVTTITASWYIVMLLSISTKLWWCIHGLQMCHRLYAYSKT